MRDETNVGKRVSSYFLFENVARQEAARRLGVKRQTVANHLQLPVFPEKIARRYERAFGFSVSFLTTGEGRLFKGAATLRELAFENAELRRRLDLMADKEPDGRSADVMARLSRLAEGKPEEVLIGMIRVLRGFIRVVDDLRCLSGTSVLKPLEDLAESYGGITSDSLKELRDSLCGAVAAAADAADHSHSALSAADLFTLTLVDYVPHATPRGKKDDAREDHPGPPAHAVRP